MELIELNKFQAPKTAEDFNGQSKIEHTYPNGNKVVFLLLGSGKIAKVREGSGRECEAATMESNGDRAKYLTALMASVVSLDEKAVNMFELADLKMKDYMAVQSAFAELNF